MKISTCTEPPLSSLHQMNTDYHQNNSLRCQVDISTFPLHSKPVDTKMISQEVLSNINKMVQIKTVSNSPKQHFRRIQPQVKIIRLNFVCQSYSKAR